MDIIVKNKKNILYLIILIIIILYLTNLYIKYQIKQEVSIVKQVLTKSINNLMELNIPPSHIELDTPSSMPNKTSDTSISHVPDIDLDTIPKIPEIKPNPIIDTDIDSYCDPVRKV
jgi:hypothetical protein